MVLVNSVFTEMAEGLSTPSLHPLNFRRSLVPLRITPFHKAAGYRATVFRRILIALQMVPHGICGRADFVHSLF
jgi:hypothetical protein